MSFRRSFLQNQLNSWHCKLYSNNFAPVQSQQALIYPKHFLFGRHYSVNLNRETRFMKKLLSRSLPKKKLVFAYDTIQDSFTFNKPKRPINLRRMNVLNKVFMEHITELLMTGNLSEDLIERGIQITKVEIAPDFSLLNVFWASKTANEEIEILLKGAAHQIRHELSQLRVIGNVPKIIFVKDTKNDKLNEVQALIEEVSKEKSTECSVDFEDTSQAEDIRMITNVYGLEHDKINKKMGYDYSQHNFNKQPQKDP